MELMDSPTKAATDPSAEVCGIYGRSARAAGPQAVNGYGLVADSQRFPLAGHLAGVADPFLPIDRIVLGAGHKG
jgi:hypothetical protein